MFKWQRSLIEPKPTPVLFQERFHSEMNLSRLVQRLHRKKNPNGEGETISSTGIENCGLFIFEDQPPTKNGLVDIIAVHGLGGDAFNTWADGGNIWLRDFLPGQIPNARIMSYGYNSAVAFSKSVAGIDEYATDLLNRLHHERETAEEKARPIIFICHSLGGILVKKALILAHERSAFFNATLCKVRGVVFMGTPHRGSDVAFWAHFLAQAFHLAQFATGTNTVLLSSLKRDSETLSEISRQFVERGTHLHLRTFYEVEMLGYMNCLVVDRDSACLNLPNEKPIPIQANHQTMCKFSSADSHKYRPVWKSIKELVGLAFSDAGAQPSPAPNELQMQSLQCLRTSDYDGYKETIASYTEGTCLWFLQHPKYLSWLRQEKSCLLWYSGDPGCGKTVLSLFLVDTLKDLPSQSGLPATVCYFFCDDKIESQKNGTAILSGLIHQLLHANPLLISHATHHFIAKGSRITNEMKTLWDIFEAAIMDPSAGNVICVIDGVDECEETSRRLLIQLFAGYLSSPRNSNQNFLKIIITSRGYQSIEDALLKGVTGRGRKSMEKAAQFVSQAKLQAADMADSINHDVTIMIRKRLREVQVLKHCPENTVRRVELRLIQNADRTFLWASLILELLEDSAEASEEAFDNMTTALPKRLDELYERILRTTSRPEEAKKILMLLVTAVRPLTLKELNMAFHLRESDRLREDVTYRLEPATERWIKIICGPFIRVIDSTIHLVHQTAKEFLIKPSSGVKELGGSWKHCLDPAELNTVLARICIWYLFFDVFDKQPLVVNANTETDQATNAYAREHDLLDYAARYWATHFRRSDVRGHRMLLNAVFALCNTRTGRFSTWFHVYWTTISHLPALPHNLTTLMVASYLGQQEMVVKLLCEGADVTAQDSEGWSALHWAVWEGNGETWQGHEAVRPLLDAGANPEEKDNRGMTALHWAAADGQDSIVQLLIRRGASINASDSLGWTPLHLAAANGHARVIKILVENGADIEAKGENLPDVGHNA